MFIRKKLLFNVKFEVLWYIYYVFIKKIIFFNVKYIFLKFLI